MLQCTREMRIASFEESTENVSLTKEDFNLCICPVVCVYILHETKQLIEAHILQLAAKLAHEGGAYVDVKILKSTLLAQIGIPQPKDAF